MKKWSRIYCILIFSLGILVGLIQGKVADASSGDDKDRPSWPQDISYWNEQLIGKEIVTTVEYDNMTQFREQDLPVPYRVISPRMAVTMDYRPDRLNVWVDDQKKVMRVNYG